MIVATAGHVDHGKTLLVRQLTGVDTDRLEQERDRGLTIDLGFAYTDIGPHRVGFVDVPGHIRFINNMLAGVSAIDLGMLIVAADDGPMPQTREHLAILDLLGIDRLLVVVTKIDRVDAGRVNEVTTAVETLLAPTRYANAPILPASGQTGEGLPALRDALASESASIQREDAREYFRLAIDRRFTVKGVGMVVTGSVFSGKISEGAEARVVPAGSAVRIRAIHRQNEAASAGGAGDRLALNVTGLEREQVARGDWVTTAPDVAFTSRFDARVRVLPDAPALRHWTPVHVHSAANHVTGRVATLEARDIPPGESGLVQIVTDTPINLWRGDRVILRDQAAAFTFGGGRVLDPESPARGRARPARLTTLKCLDANNVQERLKGVLDTGDHGFDYAAFVRAETALADDVNSHLDNLGGIRFGNGRAIAASELTKLEDDFLDAISRKLKSNDSARGITLNAAAELAPAGVRRDLLAFVLDRLVDAGKLEHSSGEYRIKGQVPVLAPAEAALLEKVVPILEQNPTRPPVLSDLARQVNLPPKAVEKLLGQCVHQGLLARPTPNRYFLPQAIDDLYQAAKKAAEAGGGTFDVRGYRDITGIGRNLCIEVLEYFDRTGRTIRMGDKRKINQGLPRR